MFQDIYNFHKFTDILYSGGMPTEAQLEDAANYVHYVINLAPHTVGNALQNEESIVKRLGMNYINIPVVWDTPTEEKLGEFMDIMDKLQHETVLVHCQANFRASSFISMYHILRKGKDIDKSVKVMREIWDDEVYPIWHEFILDVIADFRKQTSV